MKPEDAWAWRRDCCSQDGKVIVEFEVMEGPERGKKLYKGKITINVAVTQMTPVGPQKQAQQVPFEFDFPKGKGLNYCKKHFDEEANAAVKEWEQEQKKAHEEKAKEAKNKIITPPKPMLGPNGRPIG